MIPATSHIAIRAEQIAASAKPKEQKPEPYKYDWKDGPVSFWELEGYLPDITAAGDKYNYFNHIQSRWTDGMWLKTSVISSAQVHYKTGLLEISHPRDENEVRGFYLSVTLPDEREPLSHLYIDTRERQVARDIHLEFVRRYNTTLDKSRLMKLGFSLLCDRKKEEAVNETLLWLKGQHPNSTVRFDNEERISPNKGVRLVRRSLALMTRATWEAVSKVADEASQRRRGKS